MCKKTGEALVEISVEITHKLAHRPGSYFIKEIICHKYVRPTQEEFGIAIPLTIGRKNWLFFGSQEGGEAGAILFSIVQTCRGLGINPREYLEDVLCKFMSHPAKNLDELLPDKWFARKKQNSS